MSFKSKKRKRDEVQEEDHKTMIYETVTQLQETQVLTFVAQYEKYQAKRWGSPRPHFSEPPNVFSLTTKEPTLLPERMDVFTMVRHFDLAGTPLEGIPPQLCELHQLQGLQLSATGLRDLPENIGHLQALSFLNLHNNDLRHIPDSLCDLRKLRYLVLAGNELEDLPEDLGNIASLEFLDINFNTHLCRLPDSLTTLQGLLTLHASHTGLEELPESFGNLRKLTVLSLRHTAIRFLPEPISGCRRLESLELEGTPLVRLPYDFGNLPRLRETDLRATLLPFFPPSMRAALRPPRNPYCEQIVSTPIMPRGPPSLYALALEIAVKHHGPNLPVPRAVLSNIGDVTRPTDRHRFCVVPRQTLDI